MKHCTSMGAKVQVWMRSSGNLSLLTGLLLKDRLEDQSNLLVPDGSGHVLTVTHTAAVQWLRLNCQSSRRHCWRLLGRQWKGVEGSSGTPGSVKRVVNWQPRRDGSSVGTQSDCRQQVQGRNSLQWRLLAGGSTCLLHDSPFSCQQGIGDICLKQISKKNSMLVQIYICLCFAGLCLVCELGLSKAVVQPILASSRPGGNVWVQLGMGSGVVMSPHDPGRKAETGGGWTIHHSSSTCSSLLKVISIKLREQHFC